MIKSGDEITEEPSKIAEALNDYFYNSINHNSCLNLTPSSFVSDACNVLKYVTINPNSVMNVLRSLPNKCSEDFDGISYAIRKRDGDILSFQLSRIF